MSSGDGGVNGDNADSQGLSVVLGVRLNVLVSKTRMEGRRASFQDRLFVLSWRSRVAWIRLTEEVRKMLRKMFRKIFGKAGGKECEKKSEKMGEKEGEKKG